jgi:hypothetical protein
LGRAARGWIEAWLRIKTGARVSARTWRLRRASAETGPAARSLFVWPATARPTVVTSPIITAAAKAPAAAASPGKLFPPTGVRVVLLKTRFVVVRLVGKRRQLERAGVGGGGERGSQNLLEQRGGKGRRRVALSFLRPASRAVQDAGERRRRQKQSLQKEPHGPSLLRVG